MVTVLLPSPRGVGVMLHSQRSKIQFNSMEYLVQLGSAVARELKLYIHLPNVGGIWRNSVSIKI